MTTSPAPFAGAAAAQPLPLSEWLRLRRHLFAEYYTSIQELPPGLIALAQPALPPGSAFEGALVLPAEYYFRKRISWEYAPERALVFFADGVLYVHGATSDATARVMAIDARALLYLRSSLLLLYGLLEFTADCGGLAGEVRLEYNTVIWPALARPLARFVAAAGVQPPAGREAEARAANAVILNALPFKFANGLRYYALDPGEFLQAAVFQRSVWQPRGLLPRQVTPNTLFALTDRKVVLIEENRSSVWRRRSSEGEYGWIFTYVPQDRVIDMAVTPGERWSVLKMRLEWGSAKDERSFLLEPSIASQWLQAWQSAHAR